MYYGFTQLPASELQANADVEPVANARACTGAPLSAPEKSSTRLKLNTLINAVGEAV